MGSQKYARKRTLRYSLAEHLEDFIYTMGSLADA
jgi:hypothetical protein